MCIRDSLATGGDIRAAIWQAIELVFLVVAWTPFIMISDRMERKEEQA